MPQAAAPPPLSTCFTEAWGQLFSLCAVLTELQDILKKIRLDQGSSSQCSEIYRQNCRIQTAAPPSIHQRLEFLIDDRYPLRV